MSAVYDDVKRKAMREQAGGFATMLGDHVAATSESSSSSLGQYVGSAFITGAVVLYALHEGPHEMGDRPKALRVRGGNVFPVLGETHTSTMSIGGTWVASDEGVYNSEVVRLPWKRKIIYSGSVQLKTAQLPRRKPRTIIGDYLADEGND